jgi:hypothetical protein
MAKIIWRVLTAVAVLTGCGVLWSRDEVKRVPSPDGAYEAYLIETNGGATTSFGYEVGVREAGGVVNRSAAGASLYGAVRNGCAYGVTLRWTGPRALSIEYVEAQSASFASEVHLGGTAIAIVEAKGVADESAPCGGMLYNLRGRRRG